MKVAVSMHLHRCGLSTSTGLANCGPETGEECGKKGSRMADTRERERGSLVTQVTPHGLAFRVSGKMIMRLPLRDKLGLKRALVAAEVQPMFDFHFQY